MRKKYLSALLFGALLFASAGTFTSCKDYDDDIDNLQTQIDKVVSDLASLKSTIDNLNVGVTSVTFDEKTGELKVTTDGQSPVTYTIKTTVEAPVQEIKITVDGQDLKVNGEVVGKVGDTVKVENGELTINGQPTGIKVGKYAVLDSQTDNKYTITLPDKDGNLQTIELLKSVATNIVLTPVSTGFLYSPGSYYYARYSLFTEINPTISSTGNVTAEAQKSNGIAWGVASSDIDWKGPKGAVKAGQLLIGQQNYVEVRVTPQNVELDAQSLKLVDVDGKVAPVVVKASPSGKAWGNTGERSVSGNGYWYLEVAMDNTITANNIGTAFAEISDATGNYDEWSNKRYALQVNGNVLTDYQFVIDTDETQCEMTGKDALKYVADNIKLDGWSSSSSSFGGVALNKNHTLSIEQASVYDYQFEIVEADQNDAEAWGITLENNVLKGTDAAAGQTIHLNVKLLGVNGKVENLKLTNTSAKKIAVTFGQITTPAITLPVSTYKVTPVEYYNSKTAGEYATMVLDMGDLFSGLTAQEAIAIRKGETVLTTKDETFAFLRKTIVSKYNDVDKTIIFLKADGSKVPFDDNTSNIRNVKYAKVVYNKINPAALWNEKATLGEHILQMTLKDEAGNEIRKANIPVNVTVPSFFELFTKSGAWTDTTAKTVVNKVGGVANLTQLYNDKTGVSNALFDESASTFIADGKSAASVGAGNDLTLNANAVNDSHQLKDVTAELVYKIVPECPNFWVTSGKFTMDLVTKLDAAKFVYYVDNAETEITVQPESKNTIAAWDKKNGLAFVKAGQKHVFKEGVVVNGFTLEDVTAPTIIDLKFDDKAGDKATAKFVDGALVIDGLAKGNYTTELTVTYKAASRVSSKYVWETFKIKLNVQSVE